MLRALVIDDDKLIRWSLQEICVQAGHVVETAALPTDALAKAESTQYDLIFSDFELEKNSVVAMIKSLHHLQPEAVLVILSGSQRSRIESQLSGLPIFKFIEKPFEAEEIRTLVREVQDLDKNKPI
jgi:two-component system response regulator AtoC